MPPLSHYLFFIGNLGRIPQFSSFLERIMAGRETLTAVLASQIMSNVPAALLLSGFTDNYRALIVGTNIGGLGTLIASMASLISFKYIAKENRNLRGKYLGIFTASNIIYKPLFTSFAHRLIIVLLVTPSILLTSIGVNSYNRFFNRNAKNSFSFVFK